MTASGDWQPGPVGQGAVPGSDGQQMYLNVAPLRRAVRFVMWSALAGIAGVIAFAALIAMLIPHELLIAILIVLAVPVVLLALGTAVMVWVGRRAWRSGAWMELLPIPVGMPWLGRVIWAVRTLLVSRAFWRLGRRVRRSRSRYADAQYQADPDGPWVQARAGDLNGTTR
jgi:hypothetical protein